MKTDNFHLYIGSKAKIAEMYGPEMNDVLMEYPCANFIGIGNRKFKNKLACLVYKNQEDRSQGELNSFYLDEARLILRPMKSMTEKEAKEYGEIYEPVSNICTNDSWWEKDMLVFRNPLKRILWLIENGFDVGLIPASRLILTMKTSLS